MKDLFRSSNDAVTLMNTPVKRLPSLSKSLLYSTLPVDMDPNHKPLLKLPEGLEFFKQIFNDKSLRESSFSEVLSETKIEDESLFEVRLGEIIQNFFKIFKYRN